MRATTPDVDPRHANLLLAIRNRHVICGEIAQPKASARGPALGELLTAEARSVGVYAEDDALVIGYRLRSANGVDAVLSAAPRVLIDEIRSATEQLGFARTWLVPSEAVLAAGAGAGSEPQALLDLHGHRAILVLAHNGCARAVRRIRLPVPLTESPDNVDQIAPLLVGEVTRSLTFFRDQGKGEAQRVIVSGACVLSTGLRDHLDGLMAPLPVEYASVPSLLDAPGDGLGHLVPVLLAARGATSLPCLVEPTRMPRAHIAARVLVQLAGAAGIATSAVWLARAQSPAAFALRAAIAGSTTEADALATEVAALRTRMQPMPAVQARASILAGIDQGSAARSALCEAIAVGRPQTLSFTKIELSDDGALALDGVARTQDRLTALTALAELEGQLRGLPGLGQGRSSLRDSPSTSLGTSLGEGTVAGQIGFRFTARLLGAKP